MSEKSLLQILGYREMLGLITPEEIRSAMKDLKPFLKEFKVVDPGVVAVLAYLFGIQQGYHEMYGEQATGNLASKIMQVNHMGKVYGFVEAMVLFNDKGHLASMQFSNEVPPLDPDEERKDK